MVSGGFASAAADSKAGDIGQPKCVRAGRVSNYGSNFAPLLCADDGFSIRKDSPFSDHARRIPVPVGSGM
jgi:hypothetical protein